MQIIGVELLFSFDYKIQPNAFKMKNFHCTFLLPILWSMIFESSKRLSLVINIFTMNCRALTTVHTTAVYMGSQAQ